eukprot:g37694.t1
MRIMEKLIGQALAPTHLEIIDDSHLHAGHAGSGGGSHYTIKISSPAFEGKSLIACHKLVYAALGDMMGGDIHALAIQVIR